MTKWTMLLAVALLGCVAQAQIPLLKIHSWYRVVNLQQPNHGFGVALLDANPNVEQNFVYFTLDTRIILEIHRADGSRKDFPMNVERFFRRARVGDTVYVSGERDWDGTIKAVELTLPSNGPEPTSNSAAPWSLQSRVDGRQFEFGRARRATPCSVDCRLATVDVPAQGLLPCAAQ